MSYVLIQSWHSIASYDRGGAAQTRCGRRVVVEGTIASGPGIDASEVHLTSDELQLGDRSCETCLRLSVRDVEKPDRDV